MPEDKKWELGFWIFSVLFFGWCTGLTGAVIANDRIRASEDQNIVAESSKFQQEIIQRLTRIEVLVRDK